MFRKPWFRIEAVFENGRRSLADIARDVCERHGITLDDLRSERRNARVYAPRLEFYHATRIERPDLTSSQIARFVCKSPEAVRQGWSKAA